MSPRNPKDVARHYVRPHHTVSSDPSRRGPRRERLLELDDFDVDAAFAPDYDFQQAFADLDAPLPEPTAPVRPHRSRVAFAAAVTAVALPLLALDNLGATADEGAGVTEVREAIESSADAPAAITAVRAQIVVDETTIPTIATTTTVAPTTTAAPVATTAEPTTTAAPTTTTTVKPTTTTTAKPTTTTTAKPAVKAAPVKGDPDSAATWDELAECESNGNWSANTGNGYYGGLQFSQASWDNVGGTGLPSDAPKATQIEMGKRLQARQGWAAWPTCARQLGYIS